MESKITRRQRRQKAITAKIPKIGFRLAVFRSNRYLYAQIIDQESGKTVLGMSDRKAIDGSETKGTKIEKAKLFGQQFAKSLSEKKIKKVIFDRGGNLYHGRVKAFAEGLKENGVQF